MRQMYLIEDSLDVSPRYTTRHSSPYTPALHVVQEDGHSRHGFHLPLQVSELVGFFFLTQLFRRVAQIVPLDKHASGFNKPLALNGVENRRLKCHPAPGHDGLP